MNIIELGPEARAKSLAKAGRDLGLHPQFAAPDQHSATIALLARHVDELRMRVAFLEREQSRRWWHPMRDFIRRWRARA